MALFQGKKPDLEENLGVPLNYSQVKYQLDLIPRQAIIHVHPGHNGEKKMWGNELTDLQMRFKYEIDIGSRVYYQQSRSNGLDYKLTLVNENGHLTFSWHTNIYGIMD